VARTGCAKTLETCPLCPGLAPDHKLELLPDLSRLLDPSLSPSAPLQKKWRTWLAWGGRKGDRLVVDVVSSERSARLNIQFHLIGQQQ
jgi:hypothetical protein